MISNEERREVAERLRESREFISGLPKASLGQNAFDVFERILSCVGYERGNIFDYLADLIDRETCHLVEDEEGRTACSECGCTALYMLDASYCPDCGAEVVRDGD